MNINPQNASVLASLRNRQQIRSYQQVAEEQKETNPISNPNLAISSPLMKDSTENQMAPLPANLQENNVEETENYRAPIPQTVQSLQYDN